MRLCEYYGGLVIRLERDAAHLLRLLFTDVGTTQHGGLDCGQDFELSADGGNALAHLKQGQKVRTGQKDEKDIVVLLSGQRERNRPGAGWSGFACQCTAWPPPWPAA